MGNCPSCGASYFLSTPSEKCDWCGKVTCEKCLPQGLGWLAVKITMETQNKDAEYGYIFFCSEFCKKSFWQIVMNYPLADIGTNIEEFIENLRGLFNSAVLNALNMNVRRSEDTINMVNWAIENDTDDYRTFLVDLGNNGALEPDCGINNITDFTKRGYSALALNLEKCGRSLDAANIFENQLKMYDKAKSLREKEKQLILKRTDVSVNLNELLNQVKNGGIVAVYRCPHCSGTLKINNRTSLKSLKTCEHCGSEIETVDLADFLRTVLS